MERLIGASAGAAVSLVYMLPKGAREAASRFVTGLVTGIIFGGPAGQWLAGRLDVVERLSPSEIMMAGAASVSLLAWWALGLLNRLAERWEKLR